MEPTNNYKKGITLLHQREFEPAITALIAAVKERKIFPEAYKALCVAYKQLGDLNKAGQCAQMAAESFILQSKLKEAAALYVAGRKCNLRLENPFEKMGKASLRQGKTDMAAKLLSLASKYEPEDKQLVCEAALAWEASGNPDQAISILTNALENGPFATGAALYEQLTGHPWESPEEVNNLALELEASLSQSLECPPSDQAQPSSSVQEENEEDDEKKQREKRRAKRYPLFGYFVRIDKDKEEHEVLNLSATGIAFASPEQPLSRGKEIKLDLFGMEGLLCKKIPVTVRHTTEGSVGCSFGKLNKKQESLVHSLIEPQRKDDFVVDTDAPIDLGNW